MAEKATREMAVSSKYKNPFIGLRSFSSEEQHLYFGREEHTDILVQKLLKNKFLAVTGASGIGKSSFVNCGLIPHIINHGEWTVLKTQPGRNPFDDLYRKTHAISGNVAEEALPKDLESKKSAILTHLKNSWKKDKSGYILFVDHFEELFQALNVGKKDNRPALIEAYISFLVDLHKQADFPVFIIISLRSDYIGECSNFNDFTVLLNESSYLLPRMSRENLRKAIEGPLKVSGCDWDQRLVERICNDLVDRQDQLPLLQHVLMRSFEAWKDPDLSRKPLSVFAYENVGGAANALSLHAEEAFNELDETLKNVCERVFKAIATKTKDNREVRQPAKISEIAAITQFDADKILKVVKAFNRKDRSFIVPDQSAELNYDSIINLSHEALIRNWKRLGKWVDEEAESVEMYLQLADEAAKFQLGKTNLWVPPQLNLALEWKEKNNPNLAWARRFNPAYERTMVFLDLSENEYYQDQENKTRNDRIRLQRSRIISVVSSIAAVFLLVVWLNSDKTAPENSGQYIPVQNENTLAQNITDEDEGQFQEDPAEEQDLNNQGNLAGQDNSAQEVQEPVANNRNNQVQENTRNTSLNEARVTPPSNNRQDRQTTTRTERTTTQPVVTPTRDRNERDEETADDDQESVTDQRTTQPVATTPTVSKEKMIDASASLAEASLGVSGDADLKALLAYQSYKFNASHNGAAFNSDIYSALYTSMKAHLGEDYNVYKGHSNAVRTLDFLPNSSAFFSAGSDGSILKWDLNSQKMDPVSIAGGQGIIEKLKVTSNGNWLIIGGNRSGIFLLDLRTAGKSPEALKTDDPNIRAIALARDNNTFYAAGLQNFIEKHSINDRSSEKVVETGSRINSLAISPDGNYLAGGTRDGKTIVWNTASGYEANVIFNDPANAVQSVSYTPNGRYLVCGTLNGRILVFRSGSYELVRELSGHTARVTEIDFSPNSSYMASSAYDGKVLLWNMNNLAASPVLFDDNGGFVFTVKFSTDGRYLVGGSAQENRLVSRPVSSAQLAERICFVVSRNLTQAEWNRHIGPDIPYEKTCSDK
jgi:WD40 repeat protein